MILTIVASNVFYGLQFVSWQHLGLIRMLDNLLITTTSRTISNTGINGSKLHRFAHPAIDPSGCVMHHQVPFVALRPAQHWAIQKVRGDRSVIRVKLSKP
jgi:hypothetical protein